LSLSEVVMVLAMGMDVAISNVIAGSIGLLLLVMGFGTIAFAAGAANGRRGVGLGAASALAVVSYILNSMGPLIEAEWMLTASRVAPSRLGQDLPQR
jgi:hypothetical protein